MKTTRKNSSNTTDDISKSRKTKPFRTIEDAENTNVALATELARKQLENGTASAQVIVHYLKIGSTKERDEKELRQQQIDLMSAKTGAIKSAQSSEELYADAIKAMREYSPEEEDTDD